MWRAIWILVLFILPTNAWSQFIDLQCKLIDIKTNMPIGDAHVFISNTSFGIVSNNTGSLKLSIPYGLKEDLIISHVSFDTKVLRYSSYRKLSENDTIYLIPNGINIDEIVVTQKRSKKWNDNVKRFSKAFLGDGKLAAKCEILNPGVLRFSSNEGAFIANAVDMIHIRNDHLAYRVEFALVNFEIDKNGSMKYIGHANFIDISSEKNSKRISKNRKDVYLRSPEHFVKHLIKNDLQNGKYKIRIVEYVNGGFEEIMKPEIEDILYYDSISNHYLLSFDEFLEIKHLGYKELGNVKMGVRQGGLESSIFNSSQQGGSARVSYPISLLYKLTPSLIINQYGNIVNHRAVQEFGYWATLRMAHKLPLDYGIDYTDYIEFGSEGVIDSPPIVIPQIDSLPIDSLPIDSPTNSQLVDEKDEISSLTIIKDLLYADKSKREKTFNYLYSNWDIKYLPPLLDLLRINNSPFIEEHILAILKINVGVLTYYEGLQWMWDDDPVYDTIYGNVKAEIYQHVDPKFKTYFDRRDATALVGLDEIIWGGVNQDGIPPLRYPEMIAMQDADYLSDDDIIFGLSIDGVHSAYPKRILAWHEFFVDTIANKKIAGVYCTLCGTMIAYDMNHNGDFYDLGTSGFLYNSNKLMYDKETQSLWSTIEGIPVLGPLTGQDINLISYPTITTTWGKWKKMHPSTKVLSLETGFNRNYDEGEAYKSYFATDQLMFPVPLIDERLKNKDEVLVIKPIGYKKDPLAISIDYLKKKKVHQDVILGKNIVVISEKDGWSRVYSAGDIIFKSYEKGVLKGSRGNIWQVTESFIIDSNNQKLNRIPSHNSFWFAWYNTYSNTRLIH